MQLDLDVATRGEWTVLIVHGELDLAGGPELRQRVVGLVADGCRNLAVDLTVTDFIDSVGLGMLVAAMKRVRTAGGRFCVAADAPRIRRVFELTGLESVLALVTSVDDLVAPRP